MNDDRMTPLVADALARWRERLDAIDAQGLDRDARGAAIRASIADAVDGMAIDDHMTFTSRALGMIGSGPDDGAR